jgi:hypothetical protein
MGWLARRQYRREEQKRYAQEENAFVQQIMARFDESREAGLPFRPLTRTEIWGGENQLWRALVQLVPGSDYVGFNFLYQDGQLSVAEIESPPTGASFGHGVTEWPDFVSESLKIAIFSHAAHECRAALGLEQAIERIGDLEELGIKIIWDPPLPDNAR